MSDDYQFGYEHGKSCGYDDWTLALDFLSVEINGPSDVARIFEAVFDAFGRDAVMTAIKDRAPTPQPTPRERSP